MNHTYLLEIKIEIMPITIFKNCTKGISVNFKYIIKFNNTGVVQRLVDVVFPQRVSVTKENSDALHSMIQNIVLEEKKVILFRSTYADECFTELKLD